MEIEQQIESSPVIINTAAFALQVTYWSSSSTPYTVVWSGCSGPIIHNSVCHREIWSQNFGMIRNC
jgi:hypothetical protein